MDGPVTEVPVAHRRGGPGDQQERQSTSDHYQPPVPRMRQRATSSDGPAPDRPAQGGVGGSSGKDVRGFLTDGHCGVGAVVQLRPQLRDLSDLSCLVLGPLMLDERTPAAGAEPGARDERASAPRTELPSKRRGDAADRWS